MKSIKKFLSEMFAPEYMNDVDTDSITEAFNDSKVRAFWLASCFRELKRINQEVDKRLLTENMYGLTDLCARRKAYQDMLEAVLSARRQVVAQTSSHNPRVESPVNLDRVTA